MTDAQPIRVTNISPWTFNASTYPNDTGMARIANISTIESSPKLGKIRINRKNKTAAISVAGYSDSPQIVLINTETSKQIANLRLPLKKVKVADISPDMKRVVTFSSDYKSANRLDIWQVAEEELKHEKGWELPSERQGSNRISEILFAGNNRIVTGLIGGDTYYMRIFTADEIPNWSTISNGATTYATQGPPAAITTYWRPSSCRR